MVSSRITSSTLLVFALLIYPSASLMAAEDGMLTPDNGITLVRPGIATHVSMSSTDNNRVVCNENVVDVVFSSEKGNGIDVKIVKQNAFIKFRVLSANGKRNYSKEPSEFFVSCSNEIYTLIGHPKKIPSQTIYLSEGQGKGMKENIKAFSGIPLEKSVVEIIKKTMMENIPESWEIVNMSDKVRVFRDIDTILTRVIKIEGTGLQLKEYSYAIRRGAVDDVVVLKESDFLNRNITVKPLGIALERHSLAKGEQGRAFIVERVSH